MNLESVVRRFVRVALVFASVLGLVSLEAGARREGDLTVEHPAVRSVIALQAAVTPELMAWPGVLGTAVGAEAAEEPGLVVYVDEEAPMRADIINAFPPQLLGHPVKIEVTEKFRAYGNTAKQTPPIQLGTSGGWRYDLANGYCCGGTLGSLVQVNGVQYIMSNYHVLESDIVAGGNSRTATTGDFVIQPGLIDVACSAANAQNVGTLVKLSSLPGNNVDVAVAQVLPGMVRTDGSILGIGTISSTTIAPALKMAVKKSGRTTGLTTSSISGLNATISVQYENECAGGVAFTKTFTGQIVIANRGSRFLNSGDSGSLMVQNVTTNPKAVGLLYAGSSTSAIANPISQVLQFLGTKLGGTATMVGN
jgi:hypothetical protein